MASPTNTLKTTGHVAPAGIGMRESLAPYVSMIAAEETPFYYWLDDATAANSVAEEWQTIDLRAPAKNAAAEGDVWVPTPTKTTLRLVNTCQISREVASVSGTAEAVDTAGDTAKLTKQMLLKGIELRRDIEETLLSNRVRKATDPRECAGILTWIAAANTSVGATGVTPTGDGTTAVVEGTARAMTTALINGVLLSMWTAGARPGIMMMHPKQKLVFDALASTGNLADNQYTLNTGGSGVVFDITVSIFKTAFGSIKIMLNQWMDDTMILFADDRSEYKPKKAFLPGRNMKRGTPQLNHDGVSAAVVSEYTLIVPNPKALGLIAGLNP